MKQTTKVIINVFANLVEVKQATEIGSRHNKYYKQPSVPMGFKSRTSSDYFLTSSK